MKHEKLIAKAIYLFDVVLDSPLSIGCSDSYFTDHDLMRTNDGKLLIPGSSIAGPIRSFVVNNTESGMSFFEADENFASPFIISDGTFKKDVIETNQRDGIAIQGYDNDRHIFEKVTKNTAKYDYEIIPTGSSFRFRIEITLRENYRDYLTNIAEYDEVGDALNAIEKQVQQIASCFNSHEIRLGFKKNRGLGCIHINKLTGKKYYGDNLKEYLKDKEDSLPVIDIPAPSYQNCVLISCPVKVLSAISIKSYSENPEDSFDFTQLRFNGKAIIPSSSLCGALRHQMEKIEKELDIHINLEELFGTTAETQRKNDSVAHASRLKTDESYLDHGHFLTSTRTSIDRFTGSALDQSLFTQNVYIGGDGVLKFYLPKNEELKPHIGLLLLALEDLRKGYCALGGSTSIGYGILNGDEIKVNEETIDINKNEYVDALAKVEE